jgi:RNA polymerase sigma-70 factor (ECF subfamily)
MNERAAAIFEEHRPFLTKLASRITANWSDAEEMVAQAFLRWQNTESEKIENPRAFLATIVTRLALSFKSSARKRLEVAVEPQKVVELGDTSGGDVAGLADALAGAFEIVLSRLSPTERAVFLLREAFQMEYGEIAVLLDESEANCRQILKRSREKLHSPEPRFRASDADCELALERFLAASRDGRLEDLMNLIAPGVVLTRDAGDIGLPQPPALTGLESVINHLRDYFSRHRGLNWSCFRVGDNYELATLRNGAGEAVTAFISSGRVDQKLSQIEQIICPKRLSILLKLVGVPQ